MCSGAVPLAMLGVDAWSAGVPAQIHYTTGDPFRQDGWAENVAETVTAAAAQVELFDYPGTGHLFTDASPPTSTTRTPLNSSGKACTPSASGTTDDVPVADPVAGRDARRKPGVDWDFTGEVFEWRGPAPHHFVAVPDDADAYLHDHLAELSLWLGLHPCHGAGRGHRGNHGSDPPKWPLPCAAQGAPSPGSGDRCRRRRSAEAHCGGHLSQSVDSADPAWQDRTEGDGA